MSGHPLSHPPTYFPPPPSTPSPSTATPPLPSPDLAPPGNRFNKKTEILRKSKKKLCRHDLAWPGKGEEAAEEMKES